VAMDKNGLIGANNKLPFHLPADLSYFKRMTSDNVVIMGRKTYESIGKPLPNRTNVVLTRQHIYHEGYHFIHSIDDALEMDAISSYERDIFIIGGEDIYRQFLPYAENLFITEIDHEFEGDSYFPKFDKNDWDLIGQKNGVKNDANPYNYCFKIYTRSLTDER
jgi:dihydrofolate reductase